ncbi:MAG TPA: thiamine ABC transporter substrate-binding protein [Bacillota bacterium]|jgi:thiamine transport system substrate-binding protein|nr:thiamine ABC transporter substrate-binding protein [Bacillota bacterium]HOL10628.1 thiamine ABC transporter substrate-binding protein [Bacillota bacterium]HPO98831.1 thiamine ABC transporter substrate-binding protein [Bacillota bacterium]
MRHLLRFLLSIILVVVILVVGGCKKESPKNLMVYTYSSFSVKLTDNIKNHFKTKYNLAVDFKSFSDTGPLFNQLLQEKNNPVADVVIGLDSSYFAKALKADLFQPYQPANLSLVNKDLIFDPEYRLIPFDYGYVLFNYDSQKLDSLPKTHRDLLQPQFKKKIIISNPLTSSPGQVFLLTTIALYGEDGYLDYWRQLKANLLTIAPGWDEAYGMYTNGEAPIVLSYGTSPAYHLLYENTERYQALILDDAAYAQIEGAGIIKNSANLTNAKLLMDYLLSAEFQTLIPENQFMYPVRSDVTLPESFRIAAKVDKILNLPLDKVTANLERWLQEWEQVINE